jgi:hypothetical protein
MNTSVNQIARHWSPRNEVKLPIPDWQMQHLSLLLLQIFSAKFVNAELRSSVQS